MKELFPGIMHESDWNGQSIVRKHQFYLPKFSLKVDDASAELKNINGEVKMIPMSGVHHKATILQLQMEGQRKVLFTREVLFCSNGNWHTDISNGQRSAAIENFQALKEYSPDIILGSISVNEQFYEEVSRERWLSILNQVIERLKNGYYH